MPYDEIVWERVGQPEFHACFGGEGCALSGGADLDFISILKDGQPFNPMCTPPGMLPPAGRATSALAPGEERNVQLSFLLPVERTVRGK